MAVIHKGRLHTLVDKPFVLFLIGMRFNKLWKFWKWGPVFMAMPKMLKELSLQKGLGLLHYRLEFFWRGVTVVQYWESFDKLDAYANAKGKKHFPAKKSFFKQVGVSGDVGIWHETYIIAADSTEAFYGNMPDFGQGAVFKRVTPSGPMNYARNRLKYKSDVLD